MNPKILRALTIIFSLALVFSFLVIFASMVTRPTALHGRILVALFIGLWIFGSLLMRRYAREYRTSVDRSQPLPANAFRSAFAKLGFRVGTLFLISGTVAALLGILLRIAGSKYAISFLVPGIGVFCYGGYLLFLAKKSGHASKE